jgi:hypothetical protein
MGTDPTQTAWTLGPYTTTLRRPEKFSDRWGIQLAREDAIGRTDLLVFVLAAAIGLCDEKVAEYVDEKHRLARRLGLAHWGACIVDYLTSIDPPATRAQILAAGQAAFQLCLDATVTQTAIQEATDFSSPQPAASTSSSSTSSATGDSSLAGWAPSTPPTPPG